MTAAAENPCTLLTYVTRCKGDRPHEPHSAFELLYAQIEQIIRHQT